MRWDYAPLDTNPVFPGLGDIIIIIIIIIIFIIIIIIINIIAWLSSDFHVLLQDILKPIMGNYFCQILKIKTISY